MASDTTHQPFNPVGTDQKIPADVDRLDTTSASRPGSTAAFPSLLWGVELINGYFNRLQTKFVGLDPDGKRVGNLVVSLSDAITNILSNMVAGIYDNGELMDMIQQTLGALSTKATSAATAALSDPMLRKLANIDAGVLTVAATGNTVTFTGVNLVGRATVAIVVNSGRRIRITNIVDPVPPAAGTVTLAEQVYAGDILVIPYYAVPHAYSVPTDALRFANIAPEWSHYVEPTPFLPATITADGTTRYGPFPCLDYGFPYFQIRWTAGADPRVLQFNVYGSMTDATWTTYAAGAAGLAPYLLNNQLQYTAGGLAFGSAPATGGVIIARYQDAVQFSSLIVELTVAANGGGAATALDEGFYGLSGRGR